MANIKKWKKIPSYPRYEASISGYIRKRSNGEIITPISKKHTIQPSVMIKGTDGLECLRIDYLVLSAFNPQPTPESIIVHINGKEHDNRLENLIWK